LRQSDRDARELARLRSEIDCFNLQLLTTLQLRGRVVETIMAIKRRAGSDPYDPHREALQLTRLRQHATGPYSNADIEHIFRTIFEISRRLGMTALPQAANGYERS
jgi:3-deoxy-7-phosphoheptulonate synthase / chorismate mutase